MIPNGMDYYAVILHHFAEAKELVFSYTGLLQLSAVIPHRVIKMYLLD